MKRFIRLITSKSMIIGLLLFVQFVFIFWLFYLLTQDDVVGIYVHLLFQIIAILIVLHLLSSDDNPTYKMAWLIVVLALPIFGTFFYLFYHSNNISKKRVNFYSSIVVNRFELLKEHPNYTDDNEITYFNRNGWRDYKNTNSTFYPSGISKLEALLIDLEKAENFIFLEYFIISKGSMFDQIMDILIKKASEGVEVKIIFDDFGSAGQLPFNFIKTMREKNIEAIAFNPMKFHINFAMNYRDHRKIVVIDNKVAYTGGANIGDEYINLIERYGHWSDVAIKIEGEAVWSLTLTFLENWNFTSKTSLNYEDYYFKHSVKSDGIYAPFGDNPLEAEQVARNTYLYLIGKAKKEILITTPYLILDNELMTALKLAAKSGIKVKVVIPSIPDKKLVYLVTKTFAFELFKSGVELYMYKPGFIHSKLLVVDNEKALVGTTNLDFRSLYLHFENNIYLSNSSTINDISKYINDSISESKLCVERDLYRPGFIRNVFVASLRAFAPLL